MSTDRITTFFWFDHQAEEAAQFYTSLFPNSAMGPITYYSGANPFAEVGSVMTVEFTVMGQPFAGLNGGPLYQFSPATSFAVPCDSQDEIDRLWDALCEGGTPEQCGWLRDRFGVSWQIVPSGLSAMMRDPDAAKVERVTLALMAMEKLDLAALQRAYDGP